MLNVHVLEKGLGIISSPHFLYNFLTKMFLILYSINPFMTEAVII